MGYFPFFIDIADRDGLMVGGGRIAAHKAEKLAGFGAKLTIVAPIILPELRHRATTCIEREFREEDLDGKYFVIAASDDTAVNERVSRLCKERGILVNVVDDKDKCGFLFPALVKEGALTVGISTEGASPQVAAMVRSRISSDLPDRTEEILDYLAGLRLIAKERITDKRLRADFLKDTAIYCMEHNTVPSEDETRQRLCGYLSSGKKGEVILVGAGCGAYDMITLRGLRAIRSAQVLVYDDLIDLRILEHASESCERIYVGKRNGRHSMPQEDINAILITKAKEGRRVVRLKGGDPFVFGRGGEELLALHKEGIETDVVSGITSAIAIPAAAGIPVTHRQLGRSFHVITGHTAGTEDGLPEGMDKIAALDGTCIFLMGLTHLEQIADALMKYGKDSKTPAAVVHGNFDGTVKAVRGVLGDIADKVRQDKIESPAVIVIGDTAGLQL